MPRSRILILGALLLAGAGIAAPAHAAPVAAAPMAAVTSPPGVTEAQYYYYPPPRRRRVCWTQYRRVYVGYDRYGRRIYRRVPRRVCGYR